MGKKRRERRRQRGGDVVGGEIQIVKSALPVRGVTICAGKLVRKSMLSARNPTDRRAQTRAHARTHAAALRRERREMTRSGAAHNMGLMRHSRTAVRSASRPTCAHTPTRVGRLTRANAPLSQGSISLFPPFQTRANSRSLTRARSCTWLPPVPSCNHFNHSYIIQPPFLISSGDLFIYKPLRCAADERSGARPGEREDRKDWWWWWW